MKYRILPVICAAALLLTGCGSASSAAAHSATIIPASGTIQMNLQSAGYKVSLADTESVSLLTATNGKEPPDFEGVLVMRADSSEAITQQQSKKAENEGSIIFVRTNDPEYGNIFITGTQKALQDAGITIGD
ncbi:MAG: hypothetical protein MJ065_00015 [Oscillospiraceae bacterium]|nr:hypothetical protein [Oscillospiraceae bacterium]